MVIVWKRETCGEIVDRGIDRTQPTGVKELIIDGNGICIPVTPLQRIVTRILFHHPALAIVSDITGIALQITQLPKTGLRLQNAVAGQQQQQANQYVPGEW